MSLKSKERLRAIDPYEFEHLVAEVWEADGWTTQVSQTSNDMGVDVEAYKTDGIVDQKVVIQAKRYAKGNKIGRPKVQQYHSLKEQDSEADMAAVVTTSTFTSTAEDWAKNHNVKLVDGDDLVKKIHELGREDLIDKYAPELGDNVNNSGGLVSDSGSSSSSDSSSGRLNGVILATVLQIGGFGLLFFPSIPVSIPTATVLAGFLFGPIAVFVDQRSLQRRWLSTLFWSVLALLFGMFALGVYILKR